VFKSIQDRLKSIVSRGDLRSICHEQSIKLEVLQVLDCLCSVADAARSDNINSIFEFLHPMIIDAISLLGKYTLVFCIFLSFVFIFALLQWFPLMFCYGSFACILMSIYCLLMLSHEFQAHA
jgi:hypothetical protein